MFGKREITIGSSCNASINGKSVQDKLLVVAPPTSAQYEVGGSVSGADGGVDALMQSKLVFESASSEAVLEGACPFDPCGVSYVSASALQVDAYAPFFERLELSAAGCVQTTQDASTPRVLNSNNNNAEMNSQLASRVALISHDSESSRYSASLTGELATSSGPFGVEEAHKLGLAPTVRAEASGSNQWWSYPQFVVQRGGVTRAVSSELFPTVDGDLVTTWNHAVGDAPSERQRTRTARPKSAKSEACKWLRSEECAPDYQAQAALCERHLQEPITAICDACSLLLCEQCVLRNEGCKHIYSDALPLDAAMEQLSIVNKEAKSKLVELRLLIIGLQRISTTLVMHLRKTQTRIDDQASTVTLAVEERRSQLQHTLTDAYQTRTASISSIMQRVQSLTQQLLQLSDWGDHLHAAATNASDASSFMQILQQQRAVSDKLSALCREHTALTNHFVTLVTTCASVQDYPEVEFSVEDSFMKTGVTRLLGSLRGNPFPTASLNDQFDLTATSEPNRCGTAVLAKTPTCTSNNYESSMPGQSSVAKCGTAMLKATSPWIRAGEIDSITDIRLVTPDCGDAAATKFSEHDYLVNLTRNFDSITRKAGRLRSLSDSQTSGSQEGFSAHEQHELTDVSQQVDMLAVPPEYRWMYLNAPSHDALSQMRNTIVRTRISYHLKFGEFGVLSGQFTEPSGVAVSPNNEIIVADTNNHRIQVFQPNGRFKFQFGECGKRDSQLLYPNRVAVNPQNGDIVVTERSPTHQIQIFSHLGQFKRKFGANVLQHPRGITVDNQGRIFVVECKVMRVIVFDQSGKVLRKLSFSNYLEFPNGIAVNDDQKIFISDNRAHCVKMFDYSGNYLRHIGGEGITNYPIGVAVSPAGQILVADNHNNFNLTVFNNNYEVIAALESKARHLQCYDMAQLGNDSVVLSSKDYHLYIYRLKD